jgi:hypothetical protein
MKIYINIYQNAEGKMVQSTETFSYREQAQAAVLTFVDTVEMKINEPEPQGPIVDDLDDEDKFNDLNELT